MLLPRLTLIIIRYMQELKNFDTINIQVNTNITSQHEFPLLHASG